MNDQSEEGPMMAKQSVNSVLSQGTPNSPGSVATNTPTIQHFQAIGEITQNVKEALNYLEQRASLVIAPYAEESDKKAGFAAMGESKITSLLAAHQDDLIKILDQIRSISQRLEV